MIKNFKQKLRRNKVVYKKFLKKFDKKFIPEITEITLPLAEKTWEKIDCLACGNCCKKMTPTFTPADVKRISSHLAMSPKEFKNKWLQQDEDNKDWVNKTTPCQFLDTKTNICSIYEVRPADCSLFPHFNKKDFDNYNHIYEQNLEYCPATVYFIDALEKKIRADYDW